MPVAAGFGGVQVLSLESRRAREIETLIQRQNGIGFIAPSLREIPLEQNPDAFAFAERLFRAEYDLVIFLTGVGARLLGQIIATRWPADDFASALRRLTVIARGPKPMAVLREWNVPATLVPEPNTWREILGLLFETNGKRIAIQEYGRPNPELTAALEGQGALVTSVPVYQWALPEDLEPLREAVRKLARREFNVVLVTSSAQIESLLTVAAELKLEAAAREGLLHAFIASIGPTTSATLRRLGLRADFEASHPKMGLLVNEAARKISQQKAS